MWSNSHIIVIVTFIWSISPNDSTHLLRGIQRIIEGNPQMSINIVTSLFYWNEIIYPLQYHNLNTARSWEGTRQGLQNNEAAGTRVTWLHLPYFTGTFSWATILTLPGSNHCRPSSFWGITEIARMHSRWRGPLVGTVSLGFSGTANS